MTRHLAISLVLALALTASAQAASVEKQIEELQAQVAQLSGKIAKTQPKIGLVDIVKVFDNLDAKIEMNAELQGIKEEHEAKLKAVANRAKELAEKSKLLRPDSQEGKKTLADLEKVKRELRSYRSASEDHIYGKLFDFSRDVIKKIRAEIQAYAEEERYDLILRGRGSDLGAFDSSMPPRMRYMDLNRRIEYQNILYSRTVFDVTETIIKRLNAKAKLEKSEK
ncbi:OmpH family outer membrane protein [bacterium]|nr:OmpH family outer membrane protein [bacterium]